jgi:hypothetical protein
LLGIRLGVVATIQELHMFAYPRRFVSLACLVALASACSSQDASDSSATDQGALAQAAGSDLLNKCPALEGVDFTAIVANDEGTRVKQSYRLAAYTRPDGTREPGRLVTTTASADTMYTLRFYRDGAGKTKFQLTVGTWGGLQASIEGDTKSMVASGAVAVSEDGDVGELDVNSRRDAFRAVLGQDLAKVGFSNLDCGGASMISLEVPLVTLEKTSDETVEITESNGRTQRVSPAVRWKKQADRVTLAFRVSVG